MVIKFKPKSALDLQVRGSVGTFSASRPGEASVQVRYIQTHVGLTEGGGHADRLLDHLTPVREVFNLQELNFEQLMQRDINDARVSTELIPYLLSQGRGGLVKLFPPIIVVVLPLDHHDRPSDYYPTVQTLTEEIQGHPFQVIRSGSVGQEVFEFRQLLQGDEAQAHDYAELQLNTNRSALAIVDGQHRAMALLALHRNLKSRWPEGTNAWKSFYDRWPTKYIEQFDLQDVKLPVFLCTFPQLDGAAAPTTVNQAARAIFLALNRTARKVTRARNFLLDDNDLVSHCMRQVLTEIKDVDTRSPLSLRIWNVELDSDRDRAKLVSPIAVTGVTHLFHLIETLLFGDAPNPDRLRVSGVKHGKRTRSHRLVPRLRAADELSSSTIANLRRDNFDDETATKLVKQFMALFGGQLIKILSNFGPYQVNNTQSQALRKSLDESAATHAGLMKAYFFDGQGVDRTFESYRDYLRDESKRLKEAGESESHLTATIQVFKERAKAIEERRREFEKARLDELVKAARTNEREHDDLRSAMRQLFEDTYTTSAFQRALVLTPFFALIHVDTQRSKANQLPLDDAARKVVLDDYLTQVNAFFWPTKRAELRRLVRTLYGTYETKDDELVVAESNVCLRKILIQGLDPKEWPKFRVLLLELWSPADPAVKAYVDHHRDQARVQVREQYVARAVKHWAAEHGVPLTKVEEKQRERIETECIKQYADALKVLGHTVSAEALQSAPGGVPEDPDEEAQDADEESET